MSAEVKEPNQAPDRSGTRPLRVVMASDFHAKYMTPLARALADHGADVCVVTRDHDLEFGGEAGFVEPGTMSRWVSRILDGRARHLQLHGRVRDLWALPAAGRLWTQLRRFRPDVIHFQDAVAQDARLVLASGARPGGYAMTIHDVVQHPGDQVRGRRTAWVRKRLVSNAGLIFVHSEVLREALILKERPTAPVVVIPHGTEALPSLPLPAEPTLLFFGRISKYKGIDVLLDAMRLLWNAMPEARLTLAGGGDLPYHELLEDARIAILNEHVPEESVEALFRAARCVVLPYLEASQSGVGARAKGFGRPLIVSDVGALPDLVADGSGYCVPAGDPGELSRAMHEVLTTPDLAEWMGSRAHQSAVDTNWESVGRRTLAAYTQYLVD